MIEAKISVHHNANETYPMLISLPSNGCENNSNHIIGNNNDKTSSTNSSGSSNNGKKDDTFTNTPVIISRQTIGR